MCSGILCKYLEQWLRLMLHYDADKRGGPRDSSTGRLQCFKLLEEIITVKVSYSIISQSINQMVSHSLNQ